MELIAVAIITLIALVFMISINLRWRFKIQLRNKSTNELEMMVYRYESEYFRYLGEANDDVREFRSFVERRDLKGLISNWKRLEKSFMKLESDAGHSGRPLILEYYLWYDLVLREFAKRK